MQCENCKYCRWIENKCSTDREDQVCIEPVCSLEQGEFTKYRNIND